MNGKNIYWQALQDILTIQILQQDIAIDTTCTSDNIYHHDNKNSLNQNTLNADYQISNHINPIFMNYTPSLKAESINDLLTRNKKMSNVSANTRSLLESVRKMPKLRYQESQQQFNIQKQSLRPNQQQIIQKSRTTPLKLPHVTFEQTPTINMDKQQTETNAKTINNLSSISKSARNIQNQTKKSRKSGIKQSSLFSNISLLMNTVYKPQNQDPIQPSLAQQQLQELSLIGAKQKIYGKNHQQKNLNISQKLLEPQRQQRRQINRQKNFIETYFQSAKNKVSQGFSLDCCCQQQVNMEKFQNKNNRNMQKLQQSHIIYRK